MTRHDKMYQVCTDLFRSHNERIGAPVIRFLLNFMPEDDVMELLNISKEKFDTCVGGYQGWYFLNYNRQDNKLEIIDSWKFTVSNSFPL